VFLMKRKRRAPVAAAPEHVSSTAATQDITAPASPAKDRVGTETEPADEAGEIGAGPAGEPPEAAPVGDGETLEATAAPPAPATNQAAPTVSADANPAAAEPPSALPPLQSAPRPPLELVRQIDPARIRPVVQALHPSLPGELQFLQPDILTELVVTGEQGKTKAGEPLVLIMGRWYFGDESKTNFLHRYNW
jgi:hypothetical protein